MTSGRTLQLERILFFSDAVFAIAITLLVIEIKPPHLEVVTEAGLQSALIGLMPNYFGFLISFFVIGRFWIGHHRMMGLIQDWDDRLVQLNLLFLLTIAFMPFPTAVISEYGGARGAVVFYAGWLLVAGVFNLLLLRHIQKRPQLLAAPLTPAQTHQLRNAWLPLALGVSAIAAAQLQAMAALAVLLLGPALLSLLLWLAGRKYRVTG